MKYKRLSVAQKKILQKNGVANVDSYYYIKTEYVDQDGRKCPSKLRSKTERLVVWNSSTQKEECYDIRTV